MCTKLIEYKGCITFFYLAQHLHWLPFLTEFLILVLQDLATNQPMFICLVEIHNPVTPCHRGNQPHPTSMTVKGLDLR